MSVSKVFYYLLALLLPVTLAAAQTPDNLSLQVRFYDIYQLDDSLPLVKFYPKPAIYDRWFQEIATCEGLSMPSKEDVDKIKFFVINSQGFRIAPFSPAYLAVTYPAQRVIFFGLTSKYLKSVVMHEFLHVLLYYNFPNKYNTIETNHPPEFFYRCGVKPD